MGTISDKLTYLNTTKTMLRDSLNKFGSNILTTDTFRSYDTKLNDIYDKLPKVTQSGAGFTLLDVQNGQVDDFKMNGVDLEQDTTETIIINEWEQGDISGSTGDTVSDNSTIRTQQYIKVFPNVLYNISRTIYNSFMKFRFYDTNYNFLGTQGNVNITTNVSEDRMTANVSSMQLTINDSSVAYMKIADASNNLNTIYTITTNATPSPNYPQEIKVVEGRQVITDSSKNLLKPHAMEDTNNGITVSYDEETQVYTFNGTCTQDNTTFMLSNVNINLTANVTKSITYWIGGSCNNYCYMRHYSSGYSLRCTYSISELNENNPKIVTTSQSTFLSPASLNTIRFNNGSVANNFKIKVMVTNDDNTDYEPYYEPVDYNIDLTNDLLKYNKCDFTPATTSWYFLDSSGSAFGSDIGTKTNIKFPVEINKKYTLRYNISIVPNSFQLCYDNENIVATLGKSIGNNSFTFTSDRNGYVIPRVRVNASSQAKITSVSVVEGEEDYYDYKLAKMPNTDYKNRVYKNNGNWYFEENVKKIVLDGSEGITIQNIGTDNWYYQLSVNCYKTDQLKQICSHYNNSGIYNSNTYQGIMMLTEGNFVRIRYGEEDTVANFKAWLSNNNVTLWYPLVNPVTTQITNTTLINQLETLYLHTGTNIITISNDNNIIPEIEITRLKELEKLA